MHSQTGCAHFVPTSAIVQPPSAHFTPRARRPQAKIRPWFLGLVLVVGGTPAPTSAQQTPPSEDLSKTLALVAQRVESWYRRAQSVVSRETVVIQPLRSDSTPNDIPRRLVFDLRVGWEADPERPDGPLVASVLRQPVGRAPSSRRDDDSGCMDPKPVSPEPLAMLLPERLSESEFSAAGTGRVDRRAALMIDFRGVVASPPSVIWTGECVSVSLPGRSRGRVWVDAATYDVLRIDDRLVGEFTLDVPRDQVLRGAGPTMVIERAESSIRYRQVEFQDPQEAVILPASIDTLTVIRGVATRRVRMTQRFSDYRRFLTGGRIVD